MVRTHETRGREPPSQPEHLPKSEGLVEKHIGVNNSTVRPARDLPRLPRTGAWVETALFLPTHVFRVARSSKSRLPRAGASSRLSQIPCGIRVVKKQFMILHEGGGLSTVKTSPRSSKSRAAGRQSRRRRADTGNDGDGREQAACNKRRALTGFRPAPPVVGNCRPRFPRRAFCVLHPSRPSPAGPTTASSSP